MPHLLIVEDEAPARATLEQVAEFGGYTADVATNAAEALARFQSGRYDAVITDFLMPGMTGLQLARLLRGLDPVVAIIMVSGSTVPLQQVLDDYGIHFLAKPLDLTGLTDAIALAVDRTRAARRGGVET